MDKKEIGKTKSAGFEIGVRKTVHSSPQHSWEFLASPEGRKVWLGDGVDGEIGIGQTYKTGDGIEGKFTVIQPFSHFRLTWQKPDWHNISTLQIRVIESKTGTTLSFHQEKLLNGDQREEMRRRWTGVLERITESLQKA